MNAEQSSHLFSTYFDTNISLLKLTSFWIYDDKHKTNSKKRYLQLCYNVFWSFYVYIFYLPAEMLYVYYSLQDLSEFLRCLRDIGNHLALIYKAINYFIVRKELLKMIEVLTQSKYSYEDCEDFQPRRIVKEVKKEAYRWTMSFWCFTNAICLSMFSSGLYVYVFESEKQYVVGKNGTKVYGQAQPVKTVSPFGYGSRGQFLATFIYTIIALTYYAWMIVALDSLFITLMSCISAHLKILKGAFKTLRLRCVRRLYFKSYHGHLEVLHDPLKLQHEIQEEMDRCVKHLQTVFKVSEKLELIYNGQTFFQTLISLLEMCFSLYLMSETLDENTGNEVWYLIATGFELLMYCWFGNRITEASLEVFYALYESDWFSTNLSFRKQLILTMTRMQKPIYITIGKYSPLTFNTFLTMARGAYSFFTFLKQKKGVNIN